MSGNVFTIAASGSTSGSIQIDENQALTAILFPASMTGTAVVALVCDKTPFMENHSALASVCRGWPPASQPEG